MPLWPRFWRMGPQHAAGLGSLPKPPSVRKRDPEKCQEPLPSKETKPGAHSHARICGRATLTISVLYLCGLSAVYALFQLLPSLAELQASQLQHQPTTGTVQALKLALPRSFAEVRAVGKTLALYHSTCPLRLGAFLAAAHIQLQTFLTPGALVINVLVGSLYSPVAALCFITIVCTVGCALNFLLIRWQLKDAITGLFPQRVAAFSAEVKKNRAHLMHYALFLRVTPIFPAWFINLAAPIVDMPFSVYVIATAVGHQPHNILAIQAGRSLQTLRTLHDLYTFQNVLLLLGIGVLALMPRLFKLVLKKKLGGGPAGDPGSLEAGDQLHAN